MFKVSTRREKRKVHIAIRALRKDAIVNNRSHTHRIRQLRTVLVHIRLYMED